MDVQWPVQLIVTKNALKHYGLMFQHLLKVKFVASQLQEW